MIYILYKSFISAIVDALVRVVIISSDCSYNFLKFVLVIISTIVVMNIMDLFMLLIDIIYILFDYLYLIIIF